MASISTNKHNPRQLIQAPLNEHLIGGSRQIKQVNDVIRRLAPSNLTVLITGESGTGKDITARLLHKRSPRSAKPFIKVNCPAIPESMLESELFGFERGAFTGARGAKPGRCELAHQGTLFLDEIAETPLNVQGKLLQVLDGEPIMRIGGVMPVEVDVRIIAATNVALDEAVRDGRMREDLFFRLSEMHIHMPPLRERVDDIPLLAEHFNYNFMAKQGKTYHPIDSSYIKRMLELPWSGNVRELGARVKKYVTTGNPEYLVSTEGESVDEDADLRAHGSGQRTRARVVVSTPVIEPKPGGTAQEQAVDGPESNNGRNRKFPSLKEAARRAVEKTERALIQDALQHTLWNRRKAAKLLDISYSSLLRRIEAYNIGKVDGE